MIFPTNYKVDITEMEFDFDLNSSKLNIIYTINLNDLQFCVAILRLKL